MTVRHSFSNERSECGAVTVLHLKHDWNITKHGYLPLVIFIADLAQDCQMSVYG